jgi:ring-1,2-phenylacetyl-CoA epoxidase subunit PaaE
MSILTNASNPSRSQKSAWYEMTIEKIVRETPQTVSLYVINKNNPNIFFYYQAGQYINLLLDIDGKNFVRPYSISSSPYEEKIKITIQAIQNGIVSNFINKCISVNSKILCQIPQGTFTIKNKEKPYLGIVKGSGITPILSMIKHILYTSTQKCYLLYVSASPQETIFLDEIKELCKLYHPRFLVHHWYSSIQGNFEGNLEDLPVLESAFAAKADIYLCASDKWMNMIESKLKNINNFNIFRESFDNNLDVPKNIFEYQQQEGEEFKLDLILKKQTYEISAMSNKTILNSAINESIPVTYGCQNGKCGACMGQIISGDIDKGNMNFLMPDEIAQNYILCCQAKPKSDCVIKMLDTNNY